MQDDYFLGTTRLSGESCSAIYLVVLCAALIGCSKHVAASGGSPSSQYGTTLPCTHAVLERRLDGIRNEVPSRERALHFDGVAARFLQCRTTLNEADDEGTAGDEGAVEALRMAAHDWANEGHDKLVAQRDMNLINERILFLQESGKIARADWLNSRVAGLRIEVTR